MTIPELTTTIGRRAFSNCNHLTSINLPNSLLEINEFAFEDCNMLKEINYNTIKPITAPDNIFYNIDQNASLYVASGGLQTAKTTTPWSLFKNIYEKDFSGCINIFVDDNNPIEIFDLSGHKQASFIRGINFIRRADGSVQKIIKN